jgi:hypothetical protein
MPGRARAGYLASVIAPHHVDALARARIGGVDRVKALPGRHIRLHPFRR